MQPLAPAQADVASDCARAALDTLLADDLASGAGPHDPASGVATDLAHRLQCAPADAAAAVDALAHALFTAARLNMTPEALADRLQALVRALCRA